jgi:hypothetical protein
VDKRWLAYKAVNLTTICKADILEKHGVLYQAIWSHYSADNFLTKICFEDFNC